jgi:hypothetical protein
MCAELEPVRGAGRRWGFSLGCARASGVIRARVTLASRQHGGAGLRAVIGAGLLASSGPAATTGSYCETFPTAAHRISPRSGSATPSRAP